MKIIQCTIAVLMSMLSLNIMAESVLGNSKTKMQSASISSVISIPDYTENTKSITTDIVFFYTDSAVDKAGGVDGLYDYIERSVAEANEYMSLNNVSITRRVSAVVKYDGVSDESTDNVNNLYEYVRSNKSSLERKYSSSHYVLLVGSMPNGLAGKAPISSNVSVITQFNGGGLEYDTLAHELGHNDGLVHEVNGDEGFETTGGAECGDESSLMSDNSANRKSNFLSSPDVINTETGESCGEVDVQDVRNYYYEAVENDRFNASDISFSEHLEPKPKSGVVQYTLMSESYSETDGTISIIVEWSGVNDLDSSVEVYTRSLSATRDDYAFTNERINLNSSSGSVVIDVAIINDDLVENVETLEIGLRHNIGVELTDEPSEVSIVSEDVLPKGDVQLSGSISITEGGSDVIVVSRVGGSSGQIVATLTVTNGTASDDDYSIETLEIVFEDGELSKDISVSAVDDSVDENDETLTVEITTTEQDVEASGSVTITILDNDTTAPVAPVTPTKPPQKDSGASGGSFGFSVLMIGLIGLIRRRSSI
jgi:hypothetical protein